MSGPARGTGCVRTASHGSYKYWMIFQKVPRISGRYTEDISIYTRDCPRKEGCVIFVLILPFIYLSISVTAAALRRYMWFYLEIYNGNIR